MSTWDTSLPSTSSSALQGGHESRSGQIPSRKLKVTLLSSEWQSTKGGLSTINRELAIQLAKHQNVEVSMYLPCCSEEDVRISEGYHVKLIKAKELIGVEPNEWLFSAPENHEIDYVIGHGLILGRQVQLIQKQLKCKWVQVVHTDPEDLGRFKAYKNAISRAEKKHKAEIELCKLADEVVAVGPKLADQYSRHLRHCQRDQSVFEVTPSIFSEFSLVKQAAQERRTFCVLVFERGDTKDFDLKGYDIAAKAISELNEASYELTFVGAPPGKEEEVAEKLCEHGIARRQLTVRSFKESREYLGKLFCEVDLCIMPSRTEGFGLAALEALSAGLPILVSGNSGLGDALQKVPHGSSCVVNSEDSAEWVKAIKSVCEKSRDVRLEETADLRAQYAKKYRWKEQCDELVKRMSDSIFGTTHATEGGRDSPLTRTYLLSTVVSEAYVEPTRAGIDCTDKNGKRPLHPSDTPPSKKQRHDTDTCRGAHLMGSCYALFPAAIADTVVVRKLLTQEYKRRAEFSPLLWSKAMKLHLDEVYTRLKIVSRPKRIVHPASLEIDLGNIFSCEGDVSMALAEGSPGIGKTTLCLKLAYDWANKSMPSTFPIFELVLLLKCRDLDGDIMEAISEQLLPDDIAVKTKEGVLNFITDLVNQERILIILDGLDELPEKSHHHVNKLLKRSILPFCYVLATTRQEKGIEARKQFAFDICVQIKGFTEEDSLEYIRKHFKNIDPSKGERLIEQTKENTFLHALQNNPLNLLLLCVVYEDHEGKLPSSRTDLYQIIVRCLLRRYCEKHSVKACEEDTDLEKQFEENILVLGELAWECLLNDRHSFREDELKGFERRDDKLVIRYLGLVYKEESLKRLKPNHEYFFLHKSFQEYMAALYITHKLRRNQFNVFEHLSFNDLVVRFPQVFLFVCGILREEASILFTQIGEELESDWEWLECTRSRANFFVKSFNESGNSELMADILFSFIPFPWVLQLTFNANDECNDLSDRNVARLLSDCAGFSKLHTPAEVHLRMEMSLDSTVLRDLASLPNLKSLSLAGEKNSIFRKPEFFQAISNFTSLSELTLPSSVEWDIAAEYLTTNKTLEKVTFALVDESDEGWAKALDAGLCADTPLSSVGVRIHGSLSPTALQALESLLFNKSLSSLSIYVCGDMQDSLSVVLARCFAGQIAVKVVDLCVNGKLSLFGAKFIERGIVENNFLSKLNVSLRGEVPDNWLAVGRNLHSRLGEKTASFALFPNTFGIVTASPVTQCCAFETKDGLLVEQNVTLIVWGELSGDGAEALFEALSHSPVSHLTLDIHGKLTDGILNVTARWVDKRKTLSSLTINTWEQLTNEEKTLFKELKLDKNPAVTLNVHDFRAPHEESLENKFVSIDDLESFFALFKEAKNTGQQNLSARIGIERDDDDVQYTNFSRELEDDVHQVFASNTTLNDLSLTFSNANNMSYSWALLLRDGLARNTSLRNLTLTINSYNHGRLDACSYIGRLCERNTSLKNLSLIIEIHGCYQELDLDTILQFYISVENLSLTANIFSEGLSIDLADYVGYSFAHKNALKNLTLTFNNFGKLRLGWCNWDNVDTGLENKSLNDFSLTINNYGTISYVSFIPRKLRQLKSLTTFNLTLNSCGKRDGDLLYDLLEEAMTSESLETLRLKVNDPQIGSRAYDFSKVVVTSPSLSLIELTFSLHGGEESSRE